MTGNPEKHLPDPGYTCDGLPEQPVGDLELVAFYRWRVGDDVVNEQIATLGVDRVVASMQRAHGSHLVAESLTDTELHQRAELLESLMQELGVPATGVDPEIITDMDRVKLFVRIVQGMADIAAEAALHAQDDAHAAYVFGED